MLIYADPPINPRIAAAVQTLRAPQQLPGVHFAGMTPQFRTPKDMAERYVACIYLLY